MIQTTLYNRTVYLSSMSVVTIFIISCKNRNDQYIVKVMIVIASVLYFSD